MQPIDAAVRVVVQIFDVAGGKVHFADTVIRAAVHVISSDNPTAHLLVVLTSAKLFFRLLFAVVFHQLIACRAVGIHRVVHTAVSDSDHMIVLTHITAVRLSERLTAL